MLENDSWSGEAVNKIPQLLKMLEAGAGSKEAESVKQCAEDAGKFNSAKFVDAAKDMISSKHVDESVLKSFVAKFSTFWDVRFFILRQVTTLSEEMKDGREAKDWQRANSIEAVAQVLLAIPATVTEEDATSWCGGVEEGLIIEAPLQQESAKARRKRKRKDNQPSGSPETSRAVWASKKAQCVAYSKAWHTFLQVSLPPHVFKTVLPVVSTTVVKHISNPLTLAEFFTKSVEKGGLTGILALQGLFVLVTEHGLEHPQFYKRLYALLVPQVLTARYRVKFLQLADIFLASSMIPAYTAAAFAKKFCRLALTAPPTSAACCLAFAHNLIRRHPACMCLIHRTNSQPKADPYDPDVSELEECCAIESSLWEIVALKAHLCPLVSAMASKFDKNIADHKRVAEIDMNPIIGAGYGSQVIDELERTLNKPPRTTASSQPDSLVQLHSIIGFQA